MLNMITLSTLPKPEIDLSMTLKTIEKLYWCFMNDTYIEAHHSEPAFVNIIDLT